jgi:hypothetical protein
LSAWPLALHVEGPFPEGWINGDFLDLHFSEDRIGGKGLQETGILWFDKVHFSQKTTSKKELQA